MAGLSGIFRERQLGVAEHHVAAENQAMADVFQPFQLNTVHFTGQRVFFGGLSPSPDAFEQPFHSLDLVYSFYPQDNLSLKLRAQNGLNDKRSFKQNNIEIIEVDVGVGLRLDLQWEF